MRKEVGRHGQDSAPWRAALGFGRAGGGGGQVGAEAGGQVVGSGGETATWHKSPPSKPHINKEPPTPDKNPILLERDEGVLK